MRTVRSYSDQSYAGSAGSAALRGRLEATALSLPPTSFGKRRTTRTRPELTRYRPARRRHVGVVELHRRRRARRIDEHGARAELTLPHRSDPACRAERPPDLDALLGRPALVRVARRVGLRAGGRAPTEEKAGPRVTDRTEVVARPAGEREERLARRFREMLEVLLESQAAPST